MKDPTRWVEAGAGADARVQALFRSARPTRPMTEAERARSAANIARIAQMPVAPSGVGLQPLAAIKKILTAMFGVVGVGAFVGGGGLISTDVSLPPSMRPSAPVSAVMAPERAQTTLPEDAAIEAPMAKPPAENVLKPAERAKAVRRGLAAKRKPGEIKAEDTLANEIALLEEARRVLLTRPSEALDWLDAHAESYPRGRLWAEREFLAMDALVRLGRGAEAAGRGEALLAASSGTPYATRVQRKLDEMR